VYLLSGVQMDLPLGCEDLRPMNRLLVAEAVKAFVGGRWFDNPPRRARREDLHRSGSRQGFRGKRSRLIEMLDAFRYKLTNNQFNYCLLMY
jgi:hypothetical protein